MNSRKLLLGSLLALALVAVLPVSMYAGSKGGGSGTVTLLRADIYNVAIDEQNTTSYWNNLGEPGTFCSGATTGDIAVQDAMFTGDAQASGVFGPGSAYDFGSPWISESSVIITDPPKLSDVGKSVQVASSQYVNGADCSSSNTCLRVQFNSNNKVLTLDTNNTDHNGVPRKLKVDFSAPCTDKDCPTPAGSSEIFGGSVTAPMIMNVFLNSPYINMAVCSSAACPEAQLVFAKLWFLDPSDSSVTWRVDWQTLRMLRMSSNTWYLITGVCDGTEVAGLSKLVGSRTKPIAPGMNGWYKIPFLMSLIK